MPISYQWFIEPQDSFTNEAIARIVDAEDAETSKFCEDGRKHDLWCVPYSTVDFFLKSQRTSPLLFTVWVRCGNGKIRKWLFPKKRVTKKKVVCEV